MNQGLSWGCENMILVLLKREEPGFALYQGDWWYLLNSN